MALSNLPNIPEDIIIHLILPKLPPKSLVRFQCVSKLWKLAISDPNFKISPKHITQALLITPNKYKLLKNNELSSPLRLDESSAPLPSNFTLILGSCNGLVLFSIVSDIFLWNPTTPYCQKVLELDALHTTIYRAVSGFCYDASIDDYVVLASFKQFPSGCYLPVISSTLKSKTWRLVSFPYDVDSILEGPIVNNTLHWLASPNSSWRNYRHCNSIIYYDAPSNGFNKLPSPDPIEEGVDDRLLGLGVLSDCLCLVRYDKGDAEVLIMKEYGVKESWTTMFCIPNHHISYYRMDMILCSWKADVLLFNTVCGLYAYCPRTKTREKIEVPGVSGSDRLMVTSYVEALVSPTGYYWDDKSHKKLASTRTLDGYRWMDRRV